MKQDKALKTFSTYVYVYYIYVCVYIITTQKNSKNIGVFMLSFPNLNKY